MDVNDIVAKASPEELIDLMIRSVRDLRSRPMGKLYFKAHPDFVRMARDHGMTVQQLFELVTKDV